MAAEHLSLLLLVHFQQKLACILLKCAFFQKGFNLHDMQLPLYTKTETRAVKVFYCHNK